MASIHISEAEAIRDFAGLLAKVRAGVEVVIEAGASPVAVLRPFAERRGRSISECIALAEAHEQESGSAARMGPEFASDMEAIVARRQPRVSEWD